MEPSELIRLINSLFGDEHPFELPAGVTRSNDQLECKVHVNGRGLYISVNTKKGVILNTRLYSQVLFQITPVEGGQTVERNYGKPKTYFGAAIMEEFAAGTYVLKLS